MVRAPTKHLGQVRRARATAQQRVRGLLVHLLPHDALREDVDAEKPGVSSGASSRRAGRIRARLQRGRGGRVVRVREPRRLPKIYHRKQYEEELDLVPDYRITCIFLDRRYRRKGAVGRRAAGCPRLDLGGGRWRRRGLPARHAGQEEVRALNGTRTLFERAGFTFVRSKGTGTASCAAPCPDHRSTRVLVKSWSGTGPAPSAFSDQRDTTGHGFKPFPGSDAGPHGGAGSELPANRDVSRSRSAPGSACRRTYRTPTRGTRRRLSPLPPSSRALARGGRT